MALAYFVVPVLACETALAELNRFLASHRVIRVERHLVADGGQSLWAVCVEYLVGGQPASTAGQTSARARVDYKTILSPDDFAIFSQLRTLRKELAMAEAVPVYTLFTNEQLAQMVQRPCRTRADPLQIEGLDEAKVDKYAAALLPLLTGPGETPHETGGSSV